MTLYRHEDLHNPLNTSRLHRLRTSRYNYGLMTFLCERFSRLRQEYQHQA